MARSVGCVGQLVYRMVEHLKPHEHRPKTGDRSERALRLAMPESPGPRRRPAILQDGLTITGLVLTRHYACEVHMSALWPLDCWSGLRV